MENLVVTILPEDFRNAPYGYHNHGALASEYPHTDGCVLHKSLKRLFPRCFIFVGSDVARVGDKTYSIPIDQWGRRSSTLGVDRINQISADAKRSLEGIPTITLTLRPL